MTLRTGALRQLLVRRPVLLFTIIAATAAMRVLPHPPNVSPVGALALFSGACFACSLPAFAMPIGAMLLSDCVLGFHRGMPFVYGAFALTVLLGRWVAPGRRLLPIAAAVLASAVLFFLISNFGVWILSKQHPKTWEGLLAVYALGVPFFRATLLGNALYATLLFGSLALLERCVPSLRLAPLPSE